MESDETKETTEKLPCILTEQELLLVGRELSRAHQEISNLEDKKAEYDSQIKADMKKQRAIIESNSLAISTGKIYRPVKCVWEWWFDDGHKTLRRLDTKEVVRKMEITDEERQGNLL